MAVTGKEGGSERARAGGRLRREKERKSAEGHIIILTIHTYRTHYINYIVTRMYEEYLHTYRKHRDEAQTTIKKNRRRE